MRVTALVALAIVLQLSGAYASDTSTDLTILVDGNTEFALDMFGNLCRAETDENLFFSPFSISSALGMTYAGADGETEVQMAEVMGFTLPQSRLHRAFSTLRERLDPEYRTSLCGEDAEPLILEVANAIWVEATFPLLDEYVNLVREQYGAEARNVDFIGDPESQRHLINDWVSERTRERIQDLLASGVITNQTRVVLTNAIYFKGSWLHQFQENATWDGDFTRLDGSVVEVPMMHQTEAFGYSHSYGCSTISLPYSDGMSSMLILLPDGDINDFEQNLTQVTLEEIRGSLSHMQVRLSMPSFEFTSFFSLNEALEEMGMTDAFNAGLADFRGYTGRKDLYISVVIHQAFVKVDETGTEAAAATAVVMQGCTSVQPQPLELVIDRPFLFLVRDDLTGSILFMGRIVDPSS